MGEYRYHRQLIIFVTLLLLTLIGLRVSIEVNIEISMVVAHPFKPPTIYSPLPLPTEFFILPGLKPPETLVPCYKTFLL
jgi:hypothetical protein